MFDELQEREEAWTPRNRLTEARDRHRSQLPISSRDMVVQRSPLTLSDTQIVSDTNILHNSSDIKPMATAMIKPMIPGIMRPLVRKMGEDAIEQKRDYNANLWTGTPVAGMVSILGDVDIDVTDLFADWDEVGWSWSRGGNCLKAYLTTGNKTYVVKIPLKKLVKIFNQHHYMQTGENNAYQATTLDGLFKKIGRGFKRASRGIKRSVKRGVSAPFRLVKNPRKFIRDTGRHLKKIVKGVGKTALKVASSPIFAGAMTAISAIPPLTVIGGAGLAAYAAANAIKPAFKALEKTIDTVDKIRRGGGKGVAAATASALLGKKGIRAEQLTRGMRQGLPKLPAPARNLMVAALKSTESGSKAPRRGRGRKRYGRRKPVFRYSRGALTAMRRYI